MPKLGVNIDHVATLREARKIDVPDPVAAALACEKAGCDSIVCHLREDRRHIKDEDVIALKKVLSKRFNLEMSVAPAIVAFACKVKPDQATLVPERRRELTTEGGLDVRRFERRIKSAVAALTHHGIKTSLFINPDRDEIDASMRAGSSIVELHTGEYANARTAPERKRELKKLILAASYAAGKGLEVNAGHGLNYENTKEVAGIKVIHELNIGHSIIARAVFTGIGEAVREMLELAK